MSKGLDIKVGIFVTVGVGLIMISIILLGGADTFLKKHYPYHAYFSNVSGLINGAKVVLSGIRVGTVQSVEFDHASQSVKVSFFVDEKHKKWIRMDSRVSIATQGVLGDKFVSIIPGTLEEEALKAGSEIPQGTEKGLGTLLSSSEQLVNSLKSASDSLDLVLKDFARKNRSGRIFEGLAQSSTKLSQSMDSLNSILKKIDTGKGTVGALINDPELYQDAKALVGGLSRNRVMRNLIRKTIKDNEAEAFPEE